MVSLKGGSKVRHHKALFALLKLRVAKGKESEYRKAGGSLDKALLMFVRLPIKRKT
jgi:hypothetical protein